jgi:serine/threonine protein kinase
MKPMKMNQPISSVQSCAQFQQSCPQQPTEQKKKFEIAGTEFIVDAKYDILKQVGSGAYGVVVSVIDRSTDRKFAIKKVQFKHIEGNQCIR